jgi:5'-phosphate synthase pdxT subunit
MKRVGVLSLQGDFAAHGAAVERAGALPVYVRERSQLGEIDGLILPGGESSTMLKLLHYENLFDDVVEYGRRKPMFGTCAGAILMARDVTNPAQESMGLMDIEVERNAYGRQVDSRVVALEAEPEFEQRTSPGKLEAVFIRAPIIRRAGEGIHVLAEYAGDPVLIEQGQYLVATFHPELTKDARVHSLFLEKL